MQKDTVNMEYVITMLEKELDTELIAQSKALNVIGGGSGCNEPKYFNQTLDAYKRSYDISCHRVPQLIEAINILRGWKKTQ